MVEDPGKISTKEIQESAVLRKYMVWVGRDL